MAQIERILDDIGPYQFEQLIAEVWEKNGWDTSVTPNGQDRGIDVIAEQSSPVKQKQLIQAKAYSTDNTIGSDELRKYATLFRQEDADRVVVATTGKFTQPAKELAEDLEVDCINRIQLISLIHEVGAEDIEILNKSIQGKETVEPDPDFPKLLKLLHGYNNDMQQSGEIMSADQIELEFGDWVIVMNYGRHSIFPQDVKEENGLEPIHRAMEWAVKNDISHEYMYSTYPLFAYSLYQEDISHGTHTDFAEQASIAEFDPKKDYKALRSLLVNALDIYSSDEFSVARLVP